MANNTTGVRAGLFGFWWGECVCVGGGGGQGGGISGGVTGVGVLGAGFWGKAAGALKSSCCSVESQG